MDPNAELKKARKAAKELLRSMQTDYEPDGMVADRLVNAFEALDRWLSLGGFLPEAWEDGSWKDKPDSPGWWLLDDEDYIRPVRVHGVEYCQKGRWRKLRIQTKGAENGE